MEPPSDLESSCGVLSIPEFPVTKAFQGCRERAPFVNRRLADREGFAVCIDNSGGFDRSIFIDIREMIRLTS